MLVHMSPEIRGRVWEHLCKDNSIWGVYMGVPLFWKLSYIMGVSQTGSLRGLGGKGVKSR